MNSRIILMAIYLCAGAALLVMGLDTLFRGEHILGLVTTSVGGLSLLRMNMLGLDKVLGVE
jgi:hypothetical protein